MTREGILKNLELLRPSGLKISPLLLLIVAELLFVLVVVGIYFGTGGLNLFTARFYFFCYVGILLVVALALRKFFWVSVALLSWCTIELSLAISGATIIRGGVRAQLLPENYPVPPPDYRFVYHPLLQLALRPNFKTTIPIEAPEYVRAKVPQINWSLLDPQLTFTSNSYGLRGPQPTPADLNKKLIFVYGSSAAYDWVVTEGKTWVERLQAEMHDRFTVLNFGVPGASTTEQLIQTAFYQSIVGKRPVCAVYYVGVADIRSSRIKSLDRAYANYHLLSRVVRREDFWAASYSPTVLLVSDLARNRFDSVPEVPVVSRDSAVDNDALLEDIFTEHINTIASINRSRGVKVIFIAQMLNSELMNRFGDEDNGWAVLLKNKEALPLQKRFNGLLRAIAINNDTKFIDPGIDSFKNDDFADFVHFSSRGSGRFAKAIATDIDDYCR